MSSSLLIGLDLSDRHVTAALIRVHPQSSTIENDLLYTRPYRRSRDNDPRAIVSTWIECLHDLLRDLATRYSENDRLLGFACGIPGPMDYTHGVYQAQSSTFDRCYGLNLRHALRNALVHLRSRWPETQSNPVVTKKTNFLSSTKNLIEFCGFHDVDSDETKLILSSVLELPPTKISSENEVSSQFSSLIKSLPDLPIRFFDDTSCFAVGETMSLRHEKYQRVLGVTLGTRFGSTFIDRGDLPHGEILQNHSCGNTSIGDEWFSTRGLIRLYEKILTDHSFFTSRSIHNGRDLAELASSGDINARLTFRTFARLLGEFLVPYVKKLRVQQIIIGGGLAQAWYLFEDELKTILAKSCDIEVYFSLSHDRSICLGAAQQFLSESPLAKINKLIRKTSQYLLPVVKPIDTSQYDLYPSHRIPIGQIGVGHKALHERLVHLIEENQMVLIEGFVGTDFDEYAEELLKIYRKHTTKQALLIYDTRVFLRTDEEGQVVLTSASDWIDQEKLTYLQKNLSTPCVVIGLGASFVDESSPVVYIDLPKNELYFRIAAKRLDYSILNKLKEDLLPRLSFFVDGQRPRCSTWLDGETFRQALAHLVNEPIRLRPWFESDPSSGQWLKSVCTNFSQHSFELVSSENGVLLADDHRRLLEFSWNLLYRSQTSRILGNDTHCRLFSDAKDFPIRFDLRETRHHHLYEVQRLVIEPDATIEIRRSTENRFHLCMLVEGDAIEIQFDDHQRRQYNANETFLIPAAIGDYRLRPILKSSSCPLVLLIVCLKWDCHPLTSPLDEWRSSPIEHDVKEFLVQLEKVGNEFCSLWIDLTSSESSIWRTTFIRRLLSESNSLFLNQRTVEHPRCVPSSVSTWMSNSFSIFALITSRLSFTRTFSFAGRAGGGGGLSFLDGFAGIEWLSSEGDRLRILFRLLLFISESLPSSEGALSIRFVCFPVRVTPSQAVTCSSPVTGVFFTKKLSW